MQNVIQKLKIPLKAESYKLKATSGFTLVESIVAIGIFSVCISVAIYLITSVLSNAGTRTRDKIIAGYLAQEGIEVVHNIRDNNWVSGADWLSGITSCTTAGCSQVNGCLIWNSNSIDFASSCARNLIFNSTATPPAYEQTFGSAQYTRIIGVNMISSSEIQVTATSTCGMNCSVTLSEYLYNWK